MPFFILPGQVQSHPDSGVLAPFTGGKRLVFYGPDSSHGESVGEVLERLDSPQGGGAAHSRRGHDRSRLLPAPHAVNEAVMAGLHRERKVIPNLYQPRAEAEQELKGWTGAQAPLLVISAEAGSGKTNLLAEMARQYSELELPTLLIRAARMESPDLEEVLRGVLNVAADVDVACPSGPSGGCAPHDLVDGGNEPPRQMSSWTACWRSWTAHHRRQGGAVLAGGHAGGPAGAPRNRPI